MSFKKDEKVIYDNTTWTVIDPAPTSEGKYIIQKDGPGSATYTVEEHELKKKGMFSRMSGLFASNKSGGRRRKSRKTKRSRKSRKSRKSRRKMTKRRRR